MKKQAELEAAPFLFLGDDLPEIDKAKPKFHSTGARLFRDRPDVYKAVVKLLAEPGVSVRTICRECHVSDHTIRSVASREGIPIAAARKEALANITHGLRLASERVIELMPEASARDALIGVGILGEKMQLLSGEVTARIEINQQFNIGDELRRLNEEAREMMKQAKARVVNAEMGLDEKNLQQKGLTDVGHDQACDAQNGVRTAVVQGGATSIADGEAGNAGEAL